MERKSEEMNLWKILKNQWEKETENQKHLIGESLKAGNWEKGKR